MVGSPKSMEQKKVSTLGRMSAGYESYLALNHNRAWTCSPDTVVFIKGISYNQRLATRQSCVDPVRGVALFHSATRRDASRECMTDDLRSKVSAIEAYETWSDTETGYSYTSVFRAKEMSDRSRMPVVTGRQ